ncbi:MAG: hypothetical protein U9N87_05610, partial [Planctomycetota bacterium]|nr:hypothetical protein [Planctomycetota bacterium]
MFQKTILLLAIAAMLLMASTGYAIHAPQKLWDTGALGGSNIYYGSGVFNGQWLTGKINYGPLAYDNDDTNTPVGNPYMADQYYDSDGTIGDKSIVPLNGYMYVGASSNAGIYQLDSDWTNQLPSGSYMGAAQGSESLVTDGTYLYGNDDYTRGNIHRYAVTSGASPSVSPTLIATIPGGSRVRGISYNAHFDELYVGDHQQNAIYKITDPSGTPTLVNIGNHVDNDGE